MAAVRRVVRDRASGQFLLLLWWLPRRRRNLVGTTRRGDAAQAGVPGGALFAPSAEVGHDAPTEDLESGRAGQRGRARAVGGGRGAGGARQRRAADERR